jgi:LacI family transcriptional regulator
VRRPVSIKEVAAAAGVSVGTVSNVLNRPGSVADATRERVLACMQELGFVRNESARLLRAGRSRVVGLVVLDVGNPFFTDLARGAEDEVNAHALSVMLCNTDERREKEQRYLELLEEQRVQGVLITPTDDAGPQLEAMRQRGTPVVLVDRLAATADGCSVAVDDVAGGGQVMDHLAGQGHRRIAFVGGPFSLAQVRDRHEGLIRAAPAGIDVVVHETTALNVAQGRDAADRLMREGARGRPTAVFCANDLIALGVLQVLTEHRVAVPDDIAIVGYDDIDFAAAAAIPLSSVRQPRQLLGSTAARLLLDEVHDPEHEHQAVVFDPELVVRASSELRRRVR